MRAFSLLLWLATDTIDGTSSGKRVSTSNKYGSLFLKEGKKHQLLFMAEILIYGSHECIPI